MRAPSGDVEMKDSGSIIYQTDLKTTYITITWSTYLCHRFVRHRAKESLSLESKKDVFASEFKQRGRSWMSFMEKWTIAHINSLLITPLISLSNVESEFIY